MRYAEDHKAQTYRRILSEAAARFRQDGIGATGLQPLMKALGLTHGGFYAHFKSKDELVDKALGCAIEQSRDNTRQAMQDDPSLEAFVNRYLCTEHRDNPAAGCPLPTMAAELGQRGQPNAQSDDLVKSLQYLVANALDTPDKDADALAIVSAMVGALMLSRSVHDPALSERILQATRERLARQVKR